MAGTIRGITVELDGNTTKLDKALKDVNKSSRDLSTELKTVERGLKFDPGNVELLRQKQEILNESIENTSKKLKTLKDSQEQVESAFARGDIGADQYRAFQRELSKTESQLKEFKAQADNVDAKIDVKADTTGIDKMKSAIRELPDEAKAAGKEIGKALATGAAGAAAGAGALVLGTNELNTDLARLRTNAELAGRDIGTVEDAFKRVAQVSGETDSAVETVSNLLQSGFSDEQLSAVIDNVNGAAIRFSDTLKTEGIADGIQETFATGKAIGQFGELLERSGVDIEEFNAGLEKARAKGEESNYILEQLSSLGLTQVTDKYKELNPEVTKNAEEQLNLQTALADLGLVLTPLVVMITELVAKFVEWASENPILVTTLTVISGIIAVIAGAFMALTPIVTGIIALWPVLAAAFGAITAPVALIVAGIAAVIAIGVLLYKNWDEISAKASEIWGAMKEYFSEVGQQIAESLKAAWETVKAFTSATWESIKETASNLWTAIVETVKGIIEPFVGSVKTIFDGLKTFFSSVWDLIKNIFLGAVLLILDLVTGDFESLRDNAKAILNNMKEEVRGIWDGIKTIFSGYLDFIKTYVSTTFETIKTTVSNAWTTIKTTFSNALDAIKNTVSTGFSNFVSTVKGKMDDAKTKIKDVWESVMDFFRGIDLTQIGKDIIQGLINGIGSMASDLFNKAEDLANSVKDSIAGALKIKSPSRVMIEMGKDVGEGLSIGMEKMKYTIQQSAVVMANAAVPNITNNYNNASSVSNQPPIILQLDGKTLANITYDPIMKRFVQDMTVANNAY